MLPCTVRTYLCIGCGWVSLLALHVVVGVSDIRTHTHIHTRTHPHPPTHTSTHTHTPTYHTLPFPTPQKQTPSPDGSRNDRALALSETVGSRIIHPHLSTPWAACCTVSRTLEFLASSTTHCLREVRREEPAARFRWSGGTHSVMAA